MISFSAFNDSVETVCLALAVASDLRCGFLRKAQSSVFKCMSLGQVLADPHILFNSIFVFYNVNVEVLTD